MKILKKYVLKELLGPTVLGLVFFTFLLFITRIFRLADILMSEGVDPVLVGRFALCLLPALLKFTIPCAVLVGVLISFGRLAADNEILAIRTSGIHIMTLFRPVIVFGFLISAAMMASNYSFLPNLNFKSMEYLYQIEFQLFKTLRPGRFYDELGSGNTDITFFFDSRDPENNDILNIHMKIITKSFVANDAGEETSWEKKEKETLLTARRGRIIPDPDSRMIRIQLYDGSFHPLVKDEPERNNVIFFKELTRIINPSIHRLEEGVYQKKDKEMTIPELIVNIRENEKRNDEEEANESRVALYQRFSNPLACLSFILIAMPLAIYIRPSGKSVGFAVSFGLLFFYYLLMKWGASLGEVGHPLGPLAIFSPNIVLGIIGCILIYRQSRK